MPLAEHEWQPSSLERKEADVMSTLIVRGTRAEAADCAVASTYGMVV